MPKDQPKKTRQRRKDARPEEIIEAAFVEFEEKGFAGTSLANIAQRAGISRTTIYLYFDTKEAIFEAAIRSAVQNTVQDVGALSAIFDGNFETVLRNVFDLIYARLADKRAITIFKTLISEGQNMPTLVKFYRNEIMAKGEFAMKALIERGIEANELSPSCRKYDVRLFIAPVAFAALWGKIFGELDPIDINEFKQQHLQLVLDALKANSAAKLAGARAT